MIENSEYRRFSSLRYHGTDIWQSSPEAKPFYGLESTLGEREITLIFSDPRRSAHFLHLIPARASSFYILAPGGNNSLLSSFLPIPTCQTLQQSRAKRRGMNWMQSAAIICSPRGKWFVWSRSSSLFFVRGFFFCAFGIVHRGPNQEW